MFRYALHFLARSKMQGAGFEPAKTLSHWLSHTFCRFDTPFLKRCPKASPLSAPLEVLEHLAKAFDRSEPPGLECLEEHFGTPA